MAEIQCAYTELIPIHKLQPHPENPHKHSPEQIERLAKLIDYQGIRHPVIVSNRSGLIVAGHGRLAALKKLNVSDVPIDYQDFADEAQEYEFIVSDNAIGKDEWAALDIELIQKKIDILPIKIPMLGLKDFEIKKLEPQSDEDEVPETPVEPVSKLGDIYEIGNHRIMCGDSTSIDAVEKLMNGEKADMVFTDPPYGINIVKGSVGGSKSFGSVGGGKVVKANLYAPIIGDDTIQSAVDAYHLCVSLGIPIMIFWGGNYYSSHLPDSSCWIVWDKDNTGNFADAELAWTNQKTAVRIYKHMWNGMIKASEHGSKRVHPTQKPIALAEWCFQTYGENSKAVLDLFGGSGSTLIACEKTNRKCFMMELDPQYADVIVTRWCKYTGQTKIKRNGEEVTWNG